MVSNSVFSCFFHLILVIIFIFWHLQMDIGYWGQRMGSKVEERREVHEIEGMEGVV